MPTVVELKDHARDVSIVVDSNLSATHPDVLELFHRLTSLSQATPIASFDVAKLTGNDYKYEFAFKDGRTFKQTLRIPSNAPASMNFNVGDYFLVNEFAPHRTLRDWIVYCVQTHKLISIGATFS
jgi:hypothetical protein